MKYLLPAMALLVSCATRPVAYVNNAQFAPDMLEICVNDKDFRPAMEDALVDSKCKLWWSIMPFTIGPKNCLWVQCGEK